MTKRFLPLLIAAGALLGAGSLPAQTLINGAGSSFDYPAFTTWFQAYQSVDTSARFNYNPIGSGGGIRQLVSQTVDFGATDAPMSDEALAAAPAKIIHIPIVAGAAAITYNLPGSPKLRFDGPTLAQIYLGTISNWNDPKIAALNPGANLPDLAIAVVHRADGSGTTYMFTDYLSKVSPEWASKVGKSTAVKWPTGLGGKGSAGVSGQVKQLPGAIGYVELAYAQQNDLPVADLKSAAGDYVTPSPESVSKAMATADIPDDFRFSMVNAPGAGSYPIASASWVVIYQHQTKPDVGKALVGFLKWAVTDGQKLTPNLSYAALPKALQDRELKLLGSVSF